MSLSLPGTRSHKATCNEIYWNILELIHTKTPSHLILQEINDLENTKCDNTQIKQLRECYKSYLTPINYEKIINGNLNSKKDYRLAAQCLMHYSVWTKTTIAQSLPFTSQFYYHFIFKYQRRSAIFSP